MFDPWDLLHENWPLEGLRADARALNAALGLEAQFRLEVEANPSFMVGRMTTKSRFLGVGLNPRKNSDAAKWRRVVDALNAGSFTEYRRGAETYFRDENRFNAGHYLTSSQLLAQVAKLPEPGDSQTAQHFADDHLIQVELVPFASSETKFSRDDIISYQQHYDSGRLAAQMLDSLLAAIPWHAVIVRGLGAPWDIVTGLLNAEPAGWLSGVGGIARASVRGKAVPVLGLTNGRVSRANVRRFGDMAGAGDWPAFPG